MALRVRLDGRILCAAMHPEEPGDTYLHDGLHYDLSVNAGAVVTEAMEQTEGRGGHALHGEWWWAHRVPAGVVLESVARPDVSPPWMGNGLQSCPVDLDEMHRAVDLLASPSGEHVEHAARDIRDGLRIALGEPEPHPIRTEA